LAIELGPIIGTGRTAEIHMLGGDRVAKLFYPQFSGTEAAAEARAAELVSKAGLPVPQFYEAFSLGDRKGIIFERLDGETMLSKSIRRPTQLPALARQLATLQQTLHDFDVLELSPYSDYLRQSISSAHSLSNHERNQLQERLDKLSGPETAVCHGDLHPDNIMLTARGPVVIDWLTAHRGDPAADVARTLLTLSIGVPEAGYSFASKFLINLARGIFRQQYYAQYCKLTSISKERVRAWLPIIAAARLDEGIESEVNYLLAQARSPR
jgi:aminoglycoside phosphotransferase (APT) family kinase protein